MSYENIEVRTEAGKVGIVTLPCRSFLIGHAPGWFTPSPGSSRSL